MNFNPPNSFDCAKYRINKLIEEKIKDAKIKLNCRVYNFERALERQLITLIYKNEN